MSTDEELIPLALHYATSAVDDFRDAERRFRGHLMQARMKGATDAQISEATKLPVLEVRRILGVPEESDLFPDQRSTTDQLRDAVTLLNRAGLYDAADYCRRAVEDTERRMRTPGAEQADRARVVAALTQHWSPKYLTDAPQVVMGYQNALRDVAETLGIDLDAERAKETK